MKKENTKYFGRKSSLISKIDKKTLYIENQNMLELQIWLLHVLVIFLVHKRFSYFDANVILCYAPLVCLLQVFHDEIYYLILSFIIFIR